MDPVTIGMIGASAMNNIYNMFSNSPGQQMERNKEMMTFQAGLNYESMKQASELQKDMYEYTGYGSKVRQMKEAGLNPALMYNQGGGGVTGNLSPMQTTNLGAGDLSSHKMANNQILGMMLNVAKIKSEIAVNESIAKVNEAEAKVNEVKIPNIEASTSNLQETTKLIAEQTTNEVVKRESMQLQNDWQRIDNYVKVATTESQINMVANQCELAKDSIERMHAETKKLGAETTQINKLLPILVKEHNANIQETLSQVLLNNSAGKLNKEKCNEIVAKVMQGWEEIKVQREGLEVQRENQRTILQKTLMDNQTEIEATKIDGWFKIASSLINTVGGGFIIKSTK